MTQEHPITPPHELVHQWHKEACKDPCNGSTFFESKTLKHIATQAARWGADQELEACCEWMGDSPVIWRGDPEEHPGFYLREARRPKPPSLKEQGLKALDSFEGFTGSLEEVDIIRRALESLPE